MATYKCDLCGAEFDKGGVWYSDTENIYCAACNDVIHSCNSCTKRTLCPARENKDGIAPTTSYRLQNGAVVQIENPELAEHYCNKEHCNCAINNFCAKQECTICENWEVDKTLIRSKAHE
jgi:hypothetical protein